MPDATAPVPGRIATDIATELPRLREAIERVGANLLALEQDPTVALLDAADLHGETAARWSACREASAGLFESYAALERIAEQAAAVRGARREALLTQPSDHTRLRGSPDGRPGPVGRLACRRAVHARRAARLDGGLVRRHHRPDRRCRPDLGRAGASRESARQRLASLPVGADLAGLDGELDEVARTLLSDPLAVDPARLDRIDDLLTGAATEHEDWAERIASARVLR